MKKRLQSIYWRGILITLAMAVLAISMIVLVKIQDTRTYLSALLQTASRWALDSNEDLPSLADSIAAVSPRLRVTFLIDSGLVLADSLDGTDPEISHFNDREVIAARQGKVGRDLRISSADTTLVLYMAQQIGPQLILRLSCPALEIGRSLVMLSVVLLILFFILYQVQRSSISRFTADQTQQMEEIRSLLDGTSQNARALFPEYQPSIEAIAYKIRRLQEDHREVMQTLNLRRDFVANASHELRSPLTSIRGFAEMLEEDIASTPEERAMCLSMIRSECDRMLEVIQEILHLSKSEQAVPLPEEAIHAAPVANEVCRSLYPQASARDIRLEVTGDTLVRASEKDLWEIFYNLLDNAVRYGKPGGTVLLEMTDTQITVSDDGIGIPPEQLPHIFEPFYRIDESRDSDSSGTGLGLSIVRAIVTRCRGTIRAESIYGEGTRFIICFDQGEKS